MARPSGDGEWMRSTRTCDAASRAQIARYGALRASRSDCRTTSVASRHGFEAAVRYRAPGWSAHRLLEGLGTPAFRDHDLARANGRLVPRVAASLWRLARLAADAWPCPFAHRPAATCAYRHRTPAT